MPRVNTLVKDVQDEFSPTFSKRIPVNADRNESFDNLRARLEEARKDIVTAKGSELQLLDNGQIVEVEGRNLPFTGKGSTSFLRQLKLDGLVTALNQLPNQEQKQRIFAEVVSEVLKDKQNHNFRFHTARIGDKDQIIHVTNTKHSVVRELDLFDQIRDASEAFNFTPIRVDADLEKVKVQLVQIDDSFELTTEGMGAHDFVGTTEKDLYWGMITVTLSETATANEVLTGIYRSICTNGAIVGMDSDVSMKAIRGAKEAFAKFLRPMFEITAGKALQHKARIEALASQAFTPGALKALELLMENSSVIRPYNAFIKDDMRALVDTGSKLDVYHKLTFAAHDDRISAENQLRLERASGELLLLN